MRASRLLASATIAALILGGAAAPLGAQAPAQKGTASAQAADQASPPKPPPGRAIVNGHRVQPTPEGKEQGAGTKDLPAGDARTVDELYQQLTRGPTSREDIAKQCKPGQC